MKVQPLHRSEDGCVLHGDTAARSNTNASFGLLCQRFQHVPSLGDSGFAARGKNAVASQIDQSLQSGALVLQHVKCAMEREASSLGCLSQYGRPARINASFPGEQSHYNTRSSRGQGILKVGEQHAELGIAVDEVAAAWPQQDVHRKCHRRKCLPQEAATGRDAAFAQGGAQFNAVCATSLRRLACLQRLDAQLKLSFQSASSRVVKG